MVDHKKGFLRLIGHFDAGTHLFRTSLELWTGNSREAKVWTKKWSKRALQISPQGI